MQGEIHVQQFMDSQKPRPQTYQPKRTEEELHAAKLYFKANGKEARQAVKLQWGGMVDRGIARYNRMHQNMGDYEVALHQYETGRITKMRLLQIIHDQERN